MNHQYSSKYFYTLAQEPTGGKNIYQILINHLPLKEIDKFITRATKNVMTVLKMIDKKNKINFMILFKNFYNVNSSLTDDSYVNVLIRKN